MKQNEFSRSYILKNILYMIWHSFLLDTILNKLSTSNDFSLFFKAHSGPGSIFCAADPTNIYESYKHCPMWARTHHTEYSRKWGNSLNHYTIHEVIVIAKILRIFLWIHLRFVSEFYELLLNSKCFLTFLDVSSKINYYEKHYSSSSSHQPKDIHTWLCIDVDASPKFLHNFGPARGPTFRYDVNVRFF